MARSVTPLSLESMLITTLFSVLLAGGCTDGSNATLPDALPARDAVAISINHKNIAAIADDMSTFQSLRALYIYSKVPQSMWDDIVKLPNVVRIHALEEAAHHVTDSDLQRISTLKNLEELVCHSPLITMDGVRSVATLRGLRYLGLSGRAIDGTVFRVLQNCRSLERLDFVDANVAGGLSDLMLPALREFAVYRCGLTDKDLETLPATMTLRRLNLSGNALTDDAAAAICRFALLEEVSLSYTEMGDRTIMELGRRLPFLKRLGCGQSRVTEQGVEELRRIRFDIDVDNGS